MRLYLRKQFFEEKEFVLAKEGKMQAIAFRYDTGVEALRIENQRGYFIILPFQGQQVWRAVFDGQELTMRTKLSQPVQTAEYLKTYGGFLLHCGITGIGSPGPGDIHPQHGELPNTLYRQAYLEVGKDFMCVGGSLDYDCSFVRSYRFSPSCTLYENDTVLKVKVEIENRRQTPMEYMYLCHIDFRPRDGARLLGSADLHPGKVNIYPTFPEKMDPEHRERLAGYVERLKENPGIQECMGEPGQVYDPEICFSMRYRSDEKGRAYTLQYTEKGACYVSHPSNLLPVGVRWIARTGDEDACGMVLPATAEHLGYRYAKKMGQLKILEPKKSVRFFIEAGYLERERADEIWEKIQTLNLKP